MIEIVPIVIAFPLITGIIEVWKRTKGLTAFIEGREELIALVLGVIIVSLGLGELSVQTILTGVITGLASQGLYDTGTRSIETAKKLM